MIEGKKNIEHWFELTAKPYWLIYMAGKEGSGNPSYKSDEREGVTATDASIQLKKVLGIIGRGKYSIIASDKSNVTAKGTFREEFEISVNESSAPPATSQVSGMAGAQLSTEDIDAKIKAGIESYKREVEQAALQKRVDELEKENKDLQKAVDEPMNKFIGAISPYSEHIIRGIFPQTAQVAGLPASDKHIEDNAVGEVTELTPEQNERLSNALSVFAQHDPEWLHTLERMAAKLSCNPNLLAMIKTFL